MNPKFNVENESELIELETEFKQLQLDLQSNTNSILLKPKEMKAKIETYLLNIDSISNKLDFLKKTNVSHDNFKKISQLEKNIAILRNQVKLDIKMFKQD